MKYPMKERNNTVMKHFVKLSAKESKAGFNEYPTTSWSRYFGSVDAAKKYTSVWCDVNRLQAPVWERLHRSTKLKGTVTGSPVYYTIKKLSMTKLHPALQKLMDNF